MIPCFIVHVGSESRIMYYSYHRASNFWVTAGE